MYLSRLTLDPRRRGARRLTGSPQALHAAILTGVPAPTAAPGRVLWRLDTSADTAALYILTPTEPEFTALAGQAGADGWESRPYNRFLDSLAAGQTWQFRLTANPTRCGRHPTKNRTQPFGHLTVTQQDQWLADRAPKIGIQLSTPNHLPEPSYTVIARNRMAFRRKDPNNSGQYATVTLSTATYQGSLHITDPTALCAALTNGIGRGKAYGCGLLTLAPPCAA